MSQMNFLNTNTDRIGSETASKDTYAKNKMAVQTFYQTDCIRWLFQKE